MLKSINNRLAKSVVNLAHQSGETIPQLFRGVEQSDEEYFAYLESRTQQFLHQIENDYSSNQSNVDQKLCSWSYGDSFSINGKHFSCLHNFTELADGEYECVYEIYAKYNEPFLLELPNLVVKNNHLNVRDIFNLVLTINKAEAENGDFVHPYFEGIEYNEPTQTCVIELGS